MVFPVDMEQYERAMELAEKYLDFGILIDVCNKTGNNERLDKYARVYSQHVCCHVDSFYLYLIDLI